MLLCSSDSIYFKTRNEITSSNLQSSLHFTIALCVYIPLSIHMLERYLEMLEICQVTSRNIPNTMYQAVCAKTLFVFVKLNSNSTQSRTLSNYNVGRIYVCAFLHYVVKC